ncbi:MAG: hypothetical protein Q8N44_02855 [Rubrivivax sp.]|nr:hypothetical protein [Rubrivivax sp.]
MKHPIRLWWLLCLGFATLIGCGGGGGDGGTTAQQRLQSVVVANPTAQSIHFNLAINGLRFFSNDDDVLSEVVAASPSGDDADFAQVLWRFMVRHRYHYEPYTAQRWGHSPTLFLNSLGYGLCDDIASVTRALASRRGLESRVWFLNGHLVSEIRVAGRWQVYDADLEAYYQLRDGRIAGVEDLAADPTLMSAPQQPLTQVSTSLLEFLQQFLPGFVMNIAPAYSQPYIDIYANTHDNWVEPWYHEVPDIGAATPPLMLPPGASLSVESALSRSLLSFNGFSIPRAATVALRLADGWAGALPLPLLVVDVQGSGRLRIDGEEFEVGSAALQARLADRSRPVIDVGVLRADRALTLLLAVNARRFELDRMYTAELLGAAGQALAITRRYRPGGD